MHDKVEVIGKGSLVQHGKNNDRIYLMKLAKEDEEVILKELSNLAKKFGYSKIFGKIPKQIAPLFYADGYILEAYIPDFYKRKEDVLFVSKFLNPARLLNLETDQLKSFNKLLLNKSGKQKKLKKKSEYTVRRLTKKDFEQITGIYREVFQSYPFPIHNPGYILKTMEENVWYFGAEKDGKLAALASSEIDFNGENAEMTDFATKHSHLGNNLSVLLLKSMEKEMKKQGIKTLYTIARLNSIPMNMTFLRFDYTYSGTLIQNTNISGNIESMNVYYKHL